MKRFYTYYIIVFSLFFIINTNSKKIIAQDCTETLQEARNKYTEGDIATIPDLLDACIKNGFSTEEKVQAYKLIIQVYIFDDKIEEAEQILLKLKKTNPVYEIDLANDGAEFIDLFNQYQTTAFLTIAPFGGLNFPIMQVTERFTTGDLNNYNPTYETSGISFQLGLRVLYQPYPNIEVQFDPFYMRTNFQYISGNINDIDSAKQDELDFTETMSLIHFPLSVVYNYPINDLVIYASAGFDLAVLINSTTKPERNYDRGITLTHVTGSDITLTDELREHRTLSTKNIIAGIGVKYKFPRFYLFFDMRHHFALDNLVNADNRYNDPELIFKYHYVDDDIKKYNFMISAGVAYPFYTHKKK